LQKERVNGNASKEQGLTGRKRQKNQLEQAFAAETRSEAPANDARAELFIAKREPESGGTSERLMEEICEPENMRKALKRVQEQELDSWIRRRLRCAHWKHWKTCKSRYKALRKLGITGDDLHKLACCSRGPWVVSNYSIREDISECMSRGVAEDAEGF
jgi:hypothetical protein